MRGSMVELRPEILILADVAEWLPPLERVGLRPLETTPLDGRDELDRMCRAHPPSLVLVDMDDASARARLRWLVEGAFEPAVIACGQTFSSSIADVLDGVDVRGYLVRPASEAQVQATVTIALGSGSLMRVIAPLTLRERQVVARLMRHRRVPTIARSLGISPNTTRNHVKSVFEKFDVRSQEELVLRVREAAADPRRRTMAAAPPRRAPVRG